MEEEATPKSIKAAEHSDAQGGCAFDALNVDLLHNILFKLPASTFAQAACVNRLWNQVCSRGILSRPKFASALSLNPTLEGAVDEVIDKLLSSPIRPQFAIACVGPYFNPTAAHRLLNKRLGITTPLITAEARGIIGPDAITNQFKEVQWDEDQEGDDTYRGISLFVGFVPGVKVDVIPSLRSRENDSYSTFDTFVMDIRDFSAASSGSPSPAAIMIFGEHNSNMQAIVEKVDYAMPAGTVIVGSEHGRLRYNNADNTRHVAQGCNYSCQCVALVFARDQDKLQGIGETHFHVALSDGLRPIGSMYKAVSVRTQGTTKQSTWLTAKRDGSQEVLDGQSIMREMDDEMENDNQCRDLFAGVIKKRKVSIGEEKPMPVTSLAFHGVCGFNEEYLFLNGLDIKTGDPFQFYISDSGVGRSSCNAVCEDLRKLKHTWTCRHCAPSEADADSGGTEICGGFIFSCCGRGECLFKEANFDSSPLLNTFPDIPIGGMFCDGEIGRGCCSAVEASGVVQKSTPRSSLHVYSSVYLVVSYTPRRQTEL